MVLTIGYTVLYAYIIGRNLFSEYLVACQQSMSIPKKKLQEKTFIRSVELYISNFSTHYKSAGGCREKTLKNDSDE